MKRLVWITPIVILGVAAMVLYLHRPIVGTYWMHKSDNPVRRGITLAGRLGCFYCHGAMGRGGIPDPGLDGTPIPGWSHERLANRRDPAREIGDVIRDGASRRQAGSHVRREERLTAAIRMPAFREAVNGEELDRLVAVVAAISAMNLPSSDTLVVSGYNLVKTWRCESCHGPAGSGGFMNPTSVAGFIPGWYGADFRDLVRDREEFDEWIREGIADRFDENAVSSYLLHHQTIRMPRYEHLDERDLDALWAYVRWLAQTSGGITGLPSN